jgi:radical SAM superfamily enzyme YgiQ (UPF0313 family)
MTEHILLIEPNYYSQFPPLGLLKLSSLEKLKGNTTELIRKNIASKKRPDKIYVTSLFTWAWRPVWQSVRNLKAWYPDVEITLGGLYASLMPDHARLSGADKIFIGLHEEAENVIPDYSLVPEWDGSIFFASRGCNNNCLNCVVPRLEGRICHEHKSIQNLIWKGHTKLIFFDNNILAMKYWKEIFNEIISLGMEVDFNQGLEARLISEDAATLISKMNIPRVRLAYDNSAQKEFVKNAINLLGKKGIHKRQILIYTMFNFTESPDDFLDRVRDILEWGAACYPMRFQPVNTLKKDSYVASNWTQEQLNMVAAARRVIGYGGAFPPYEGLKKKFLKAHSFDEAFELYPIKTEIPKKRLLKK